MSTSRDTYHHGQLPQTLESAAIKLLDTMPAHEISLREVARAAGVSHNAPYHHFTNRLGLLQTLAESSMRQLLDAVQEAVASAQSPAQALRKGGAAYISFAVERPHAFNAVYDPTVCVPGSPSEKMAPLIEALESALFEASTEAGLDSTADAHALWALIHGLGVLSAAGHFPLTDAHASYDAALSRLLSTQQ